ncbi:MAG: single-stranded DNA-binding protein [Candidatus Paceibacterota bacterium]|jgi:single-strand DNA-binding protein
MYLNKAFLFGNLTRDPELKSLPSGIKVVSFGLATNRTWKDKNGVKQESTSFHNIVAFGRTAEVMAQYLKKGSSVFVEGRIETRSWDDKNDGTKKYRTEIIVDNFQFGPSTGGPRTEGSPKTHKEEAPVAKGKQMDTIEYPTEEINPEDIPF